MVTMVRKTNDDSERCEEESGKGNTAFAGPTTGLPMAGETVFAGVGKCVKIHCKVWKICCRIPRDLALGNWGTDDKIIGDEIVNPSTLTHFPRRFRRR